MNEKDLRKAIAKLLEKADKDALGMVYQFLRGMEK
jgi:hypothetical protein